MDLASETREALLRRMRREASDAGRLARYRAEQLLELAGRDADREKIEAAAAERFRRMDDAQREALVMFTLEYRDGETPGAARRLDPTTIPPRRKETEMPELTEEQRETIRAMCEEAFEADPKAKPGPVHNAVLEKGIDLPYRNFTNGYWYPARDRLGIASPRKRKATKVKAGANGTKPAPAPKAEAPPKLARVIRKVEPAPADLPARYVDDQGLQLRKLPSGLFRLEFAAEVFEADAYRVAAAIGKAMAPAVEDA